MGMFLIPIELNKQLHKSCIYGNPMHVSSDENAIVHITTNFEKMANLKLAQRCLKMINL